jgi:hypothetical protein
VQFWIEENLIFQVSLEVAVNRFSNNTQISHLMKIHPVEVSCSVQTGRKNIMYNIVLIVNFHC